MKTTESISRLGFLKQPGLTGSALSAFCCTGTLTACSNTQNEVTPLPTDGVTLDLTSSAYARLKTIGGFAYSGNILVARIQNGSYVALSKVCTHEGGTVQYVASSDSLLCPNHGARFSTTGTVTQGPATRALTQYNATLSADGNSLVITNRA